MPHNSGRSQLNTWFQQYEGTFAFMNAAKGSQRMGCVNTATFLIPPATTLDPNGYPTDVSQTGGIGGLYFVEGVTYRPGLRVALFTADAAGRVVKVDGHTFTSSGAGLCRNTYTPSGEGILFQITTVGVSNFADVHSDDEALYNAGQVFGVKFKARLTEALIGRFRGMDWQWNNLTNVRRWSDRKPVGYITYYGEEYKASLYGGTTTNTGNDYTISAPPAGFTYADKDAVILQWGSTNPNAGVIRLRVGAGAYKQVCDAVGDALYDASRCVARHQSMLVFDAVLDRWVCFGQDGDDSGLMSGVPPELIVQLCEEMGMHPWLMQPYLAADPCSDFISELATYCAGRSSASWMKPGFEGPNETWNFGGGFYATRYAWNMADEHWQPKHAVTMTLANPCVVAWPSHGLAAGSKFRFQTTGKLYDGVIPNREYIVLTVQDSGHFTFTLDGVTAIASSGTQSGSHVAWAMTFALNDWYGKVMTQMGKSVSTVYSNDRTKYDVINAVFTVFGSSGNAARFESAKYVVETGQATDASKYWCTELAVTLYFAPDITNTAAETTMGAAYAAANAAGKARIARDYVNDCLTVSTINVTIPYMKNLIDDFSSYLTTISATPGVHIKLTSYEGGYSPNPSFDTNVNDLRNAGKFVPELGPMLIDLYTYFVAKGGEYPSQYMMSGPIAVTGVPHTGNVWSAFDSTVWDSSLTPTWKGIVRFNAIKPHTTGAVLLGLQGVGYYTGYNPFLDWWKVAGTWVVYSSVHGVLQGRGVWDNGTYLDANGNLKVPLPSDVTQVRRVFIATASNANPYNGVGFTMTYSGAATVDVGGLDTAHGGGITTNSTGLCKWTMGQIQSNVWIDFYITDRFNPPRSIHIYEDRYATNWNNGERFNPDWFNEVKNFATIRFMDWMGTNNQELKDVANQADIDWYSWGKEGTAWHPTAGGIGYPPSPYGDKGGMPWQLMAELANASGADIHVCIPHTATDAFVTAMATYFRNTVNGPSVVHYEYTNEHWNFGFDQYVYCYNNGLAKFGTGLVDSRWYGWRSAACMKLIRDVYGSANRSRWKGILATQNDTPFVSQEALFGVNYWLTNDLSPPNSLNVPDLYDALAGTGYFGDGILAPPITAITKASPAVITINPNYAGVLVQPNAAIGTAARVKINIMSADLMVQLNNEYAVVKSKATPYSTTFDLYHPDGVTPWDTTSYPAFVNNTAASFMVKSQIWDLMDTSTALNISQPGTYPTKYTYFNQQMVTSWITGTCSPEGIVTGQNLNNRMIADRWPAQRAIAVAAGLQFEQYEGGLNFQGDAYLQGYSGSNTLGDQLLDFMIGTAHTAKTAEAYTAMFNGFFSIGGVRPAKFVEGGMTSAFGSWGGFGFIPGDETNPVWVAVKNANGFVAPVVQVVGPSAVGALAITNRSSRPVRYAARR